MFDPRQNNLYEGKRRRGLKCEKELCFHTAFPPYCSQSMQKKWACTACQCESSLAVRACTWSREAHAKGQGSPPRLKQSWSSNSAREGQLSSTLNNMRLSVVPSISFFVSPSSLVYLFSLLLWRDAVIHNPLDYRQLNYPPPVCPFSPLGWRFKKQLTSSWLGTFSQERAQR